jgi:hypothetical protein
MNVRGLEFENAAFESEQDWRTILREKFYLQFNRLEKIAAASRLESSLTDIVVGQNIDFQYQTGSLSVQLAVPENYYRSVHNNFLHLQYHFTPNKLPKQTREISSFSFTDIYATTDHWPTSAFTHLPVPALKAYLKPQINDMDQIASTLEGAIENPMLPNQAIWRRLQQQTPPQAA